MRDPGWRRQVLQSSYYKYVQTTKTMKPCLKKLKEKQDDHGSLIGNINKDIEIILKHRNLDVEISSISTLVEMENSL